MKKLLTLLLLSVTLALPAQNYYRLRLTDKNHTPYSIDDPAKFLSQRAIDRRQRQQLPIDSTDLPVNPAYLKSITNMGGRVVCTSRWNNTAVVEMADSAMLLQVSQLPCVKGCELVWVRPDSVSAPIKHRKKQITNNCPKPDKENLYGDQYRQIEIHHGEQLHAAGFRGKGMQIAIIDGGFLNADAIRVFRHTDLLGTYDFVNGPKGNVFEQGSHGTMVWSCMGANMPGVLVGTAPDASYWLLRSEDGETEQPVEQDYWAAAIEFADSVGADVVNSSLGYAKFDAPHQRVRYRDLDGHSTLISNSASMAADKGMVVVNSAGNSGSKAWKKITPPADAENIITVGALTKELVNTTFSAVGNTADNRIKPNVMAVGQKSTVVNVAGEVHHSNGTSFSSPTFCGLVACLWQACPWLTAKQLIRLIEQNGSQADYPDNVFGYGIVNVWEAYNQAHNEHQ